MHQQHNNREPRRRAVVDCSRYGRSLLRLLELLRLLLELIAQSLLVDRVPCAVFCLIHRIRRVMQRVFLVPD